MGGFVCWTIVIVGTAAVLAGVYFFATLGGELALKREKAEHLRIVNEARRRAKLPPLTEREISFETQADRESQTAKEVISDFFGIKQGPGFEVGEIKEEDIPMATPVATPPPVPTDLRPLYSIILLEAEHRPLDKRKLQQLVEKAWGVEFPKDEAHATEFIIAPDHPDSPFLLSVGGMRFYVRNRPFPYFDNPAERASSIRDGRLRKAVMENRAVRSVELLDGEAEQDIPENNAYALMGKLAAQLAGNPTLGILLPDRDHEFFPYNENTLRALLSEDVLTELRDAPRETTALAQPEDPELIAAMTQARRRLHEFESELASKIVIRGQKNPFLIKAPFTDGMETEYLWVEVIEITNGKAEGYLASEPVNLRNYVKDEQVSVPVGLISDWMMMRNGEPVGNFTGPVISARQQGRI